MDASVVVLLSLLIGALVGAGLMAVLREADLRRARLLRMLDAGLPEGLDQLLDALGSVSIVTDASHNVYLANAAAPGLGLVQRGDRLDPRIGAIVDESREAGDAVERDIEVPRGPFGGVALHLRVHVAPISVRHFLVLVEDRTEAIRVEQVRRDFVANVSHELKTPIGAVTLLAEAIGEAADDEEQVRYFTGRLEVEAARLKRLTNELIDLSRLQATDSMQDAEVLDLAEVVDLAIDQARVPATSRRIRLTVNIPDGIHIFGDKALLLMGFHNLVANAIHYSAEGSPVGVGARVVDDTVELAVTDQGIGIAPDDQQRIFERFYRVDPARSRRTGGTGLGLSIVKHVIENHGGDIRVWSKLGKGSTFTVRLPLADADAVDAEREREAARERGVEDTGATPGASREERAR